MIDIPTTAAELAKSTFAYSVNFARVVSADANRVELAFDLNHEYWPWLALPPQHPVMLEKYQYFSSITAGWATGIFDPATYLALTQFNWQCPELYADCDHGARACIVNRETDDGVVMCIDVYDETDNRLAHMECVGAAFGDRDFKAWRSTSRHKALVQAGTVTGDYASPDKAGLGKTGISLISALDESGEMPCVTALVTSENSFYPNHPFHTGSGDHVNVGHYFDCVLQMAHLILKPDQTLLCTGGETSFMRFTELDVPFEIRLVEQSDTGTGEFKLSFALSQLGKDNAHIKLGLLNTRS